MLNKILKEVSIIEPLMYNAIAHRKGEGILLDEFVLESSNEDIETLAEHSKRTLTVFHYLVRDNNVLEKCAEGKPFFVELMYLAVYLHDFGKCNPLFQEKIRKCKSPKTCFEDFKIKTTNSNHSEYSRFAFLIREFLPHYYDEELCLYFDELIERHHSSLELEEVPGKDGLFISQILFSFMINADIIATKWFYLGGDLEEYVNNYSSRLKNLKIGLQYNQEIYAGDDSSLTGNLNEIKVKLGREVVKNIKEGVCLLKAPTGSGKTNLSFLYINEIFKKKKVNRVVYINPLNVLNYQVRDCVKEAFGLDSYVINNETKYEHKYSEDKNLTLEKFQNYNYPFVITSHVNFFEKLYSNNKRDKLSLINLIDSVLIIDEIQLYKEDIAFLNYEFIRLLNEYLGCQILIISATIPPFYKDFKVNFLLSKEYETELFNHEVFKRVRYSLDYFDSNPRSVILDSDKKSFLITCNTIKKSEDLYHQELEFLEQLGFKVYLFNSHLIQPVKESVLKEMKERLSAGEKVVCISTSAIEVGVDISFECGIRFSTEIHNILQNAGRINRYGLSSGEFYLIKDSLRREGMGLVTSFNSLNKEWFADVFSEFNVDVDLAFKRSIERSGNVISNMKRNLSYLENASFDKLRKIDVIEEEGKYIIIVDALELVGEEGSVEDVLLKLNRMNVKEYDYWNNVLGRLSFRSYKGIGEKIGDYYVLEKELYSFDLSLN